MHNLSHMPLELAEIIDTHRRLFGGVQMMADEAPADGAKPKTDADKAEDDQGANDADTNLSEGGLRALQVERDARKKLQKEVDDLKGAKDTLDQLAKVFAKDGEKPDPTADLASQIAEMRKQLDDAAADKARDAQAAKVAKEAGITDVDDVALIKAQADEDAMKALANRLKGISGQVQKGGRTLRPDPSQGSDGGSSRPTSVAQVMAERRAAREKNNSK